MFLLFEMMWHLSNGGIGNSWSLTFPTLGLPHPVLCPSVLYTHRLKRLKKDFIVVIYTKRISISVVINRM